MKRVNILVSIALILALLFFALEKISEANRYTSVRKYSKPPSEDVSPTNGASSTESSPSR